MTIGPIETIYKGCRFRSRLEARWAVFFDEAGIPWQYEPEGFETHLSMEGGMLVDTEDEPPPCWRYLPDFFLPKTKTWVEVKGSRDALLTDWKRLAHILDFASPLPGVQDSSGTNRGLLILGEIPFLETGEGFVIHPLIQHSKGLIRNWATFIPDEGAELMDPQSLAAAFLGIPKREYALEAAPDAWTVEARVIACSRFYRKVNRAYQAARSARFEFAPQPPTAAQAPRSGGGSP